MRALLLYIITSSFLSAGEVGGGGGPRVFSFSSDQNTENIITLNEELDLYNFKNEDVKSIYFHNGQIERRESLIKVIGNDPSFVQEISEIHLQDGSYIQFQ